jgi:hypothetical protein
VKQEKQAEENERWKKSRRGQKGIRRSGQKTMRAGRRAGGLKVK